MRQAELTALARNGSRAEIKTGFIYLFGNMDCWSPALLDGRYGKLRLGNAHEFEIYAC